LLSVLQHLLCMLQDRECHSIVAVRIEPTFASRVEAIAKAIGTHSLVLLGLVASYRGQVQIIRG